MDLPPLFLTKKGVASYPASVLASRALRGDDPCAVSSVVEHHLDTVGVTGSKPVSRTIFTKIFDSF